LDENQTSTLGEHSVIAVCNDDGYDGYSIFNYKITPTGQEINSSQGLASIALIISIIFLAGMFSYFGHKFSEVEKLFPIAILFMGLSLILGIYILHLGYIYSRDVLFPLSVEGSQFRVYIAIIWVSFILILVAFSALFIKTLKEIKIKKAIQKHGEGYDPEKKQYR